MANGRDGILNDFLQAEYDTWTPAKKEHFDQLRAFAPHVDLEEHKNFPVNTNNHSNQPTTYMPLIAESKTTYKPVPAGSHVARCIRVIDLGTQHGEYKGKPNVGHKIMITFELPECTMEYDGETKPMVISKEYTLSLGEKSTLRKELKNWRGKDFTEEELKGFDILNLLDKTCMVSVIHTATEGKTRAKIESISPMHKSLTCDPSVNEIYAYLVEEGTGGHFSKLPEWIQNKIKDSDEVKGVATTQAAQTATFETAGVSDDEEPPF